MTDHQAKQLIQVLVNELAKQQWPLSPCSSSGVFRNKEVQQAQADLVKGERTTQFYASYYGGKGFVYEIHIFLDKSDSQTGRMVECVIGVGMVYEEISTKLNTAAENVWQNN